MVRSVPGTFRSRHASLKDSDLIWRMNAILGTAIAMSRSKRKNGQITVKVGPEGMPQAVLKLRAE